MSELKELSFTVSGRVAKPCAEVYEAVADPEQLSKYFTTGGARGRLTPGIDNNTRTLVTITESSWRPAEAGAKNAFGNCEGWTGMLAALKVWVEHGINLREGFYR